MAGSTPAPQAAREDNITETKKREIILHMLAGPVLLPFLTINDTVNAVRSGVGRVRTYRERRSMNLRADTGSVHSTSPLLNREFPLSSAYRQELPEVKEAREEDLVNGRE